MRPVTELIDQGTLFSLVEERPTRYGRVTIALNNICLEALDRFGPLTLYQRLLNIKDAQETRCQVLGTSGLSSRSPGHSLGDRVPG